jgi:hypothetical protein
MSAMNEFLPFSIVDRAEFYKNLFAAVWSAVTAVTALTAYASPEREVKAVTAVTALQTLA